MRGRLDPVIGRQEEIERVIQILARRTKNNPAPIGEPGVGKTAIVEGLAQRIISGAGPDPLESAWFSSMSDNGHNVPWPARGALEEGP